MLQVLDSPQGKSATTLPDDFGGLSCVPIALINAIGHRSKAVFQLISLFVGNDTQAFGIKNLIQIRIGLEITIPMCTRGISITNVFTA